MTTVNLHGLLGQEYQNQFVLKIERAKDIILAIDCNRKGFLKRVNSLKKEGLYYDVIINGGKIECEGSVTEDIKQVDLVPVIAGSFTAMIGWISTAWAAIGFTTVAYPMLAKLAIGVGAAALASALRPKPEKQPDVGGVVTTDAGTPAQDEPVTFQSRAAAASMMFNNVANVASQGAPLPIGFGRLKIGSSVIQATLKSFPMTDRTARAFERNPFLAFDETEYSTDMQQIYTASDD